MTEQDKTIGTVAVVLLPGNAVEITNGPVFEWPVTLTNNIKPDPAF